ncbi:MAG: flagellar biosynthesis protein FlhB [Smithellaceae bacterium]|nr:flagellar biosynthesis protein FlhB [Smithellaceae bacterium]
MPENESGQEKTEQATPKRREEARQKGQVAKSREIPSVAVLLVCLMFFYFNASGIIDQLSRMLKNTFLTAGQTQVGMENIQDIFLSYANQAFLLLLPMFLLVMGASILANVVQVGFLISAESIMPKLSKLDPLKGFTRLFSMRAVIELLKTILKMVLVGTVAYMVLRNDLSEVILLIDKDAPQVLSFMGMVSFKILLSTCALLLLLAAFDYLFQRHEHEKSIKMTKDEVKREFRNMEGDPLIKARIRRIQRELAKKRMMAAVPKADVVITNPTHLAVALMYDYKTMKVPIVVAKGAGLIAEKIKELAREHNVPLVENKSVAQVLYKFVQIGGAIPDTLYRAVAEILAYVYRLKDKWI